ncbi:MAG: NEW3 domain-containing protein [Acidimicrobiia bacterium]
MRTKIGLVGLATALLTLTVPLTAGAQEAAGVTLSSQYPCVMVEAGDTAGFDIRIESDVRRTFSVEVIGLPEGWDSAIRGGGTDVNRVSAGSGDDAAAVDLDVIVPFDAAEGDYPFELVATADGVRATLDLLITVRAGAGGEVLLNPEFPGLRGPADATFTFTVEVENQTAEEVQLELAATGPQGWRVDARPSGESQASTVTVDAGGRQRVTVEARPPITVQSGDYEITLTASGSGVEVSTPLTVRITGDVAIEISTPDNRLNASVTTGEPTVIPLVVINVGTAPLTNVQLNATAPRGWEVKFAPEAIPSLAAGEVANVEATVTPAADALAGDYRITFRSSVDQAQDSIEIRTTVDPSTTWGLIGVGVIALTLVGLAWVFRKFGRR